MNPLDHKQKIQNDQRKRTLLRYISSFVATVAVVTVAAVVVSSAPKARFVDVYVSQNSIFYSLELLDIDEDELGEFYVVLENQLFFEQREILSLQTQGTFTNLNNNEEYILKIVGKGVFAQKVYDSRRIALATNATGNILDISFHSPEEFMIAFVIDVLYSDTKSQYKEVYIEYSYQYLEFPEVTEVESILLTQETSNVELDPVYQENMILRVSLVGITQADERVLLDSKSYQTPLFLHWELYIFTVTNVSISGFAYYVTLDFIEIEYWVELYLEDVMLEQIPMEEPQQPFTFEALQRNTTYRIILRASYELNGIVVEELLQEESIKTLLS